MMLRTIISGYLLHFCVIIFTLIGQSIAIKCYRCSVTSDYRYGTNSSTPLCSKFDGSNDFIIDCPYSTMCRKKILKLELQNGEWTETITRGCASQKYTDQVFKQGAWRAEHKVEEPYEEGCKELKENNLAASVTTYCHCRGNLCNSASKESIPSLHTDAMAVIFVFNVMKYLRIGGNGRGGGIAAGQ